MRICPRPPAGTQGAGLGGGVEGPAPRLLVWSCMYLPALIQGRDRDGQGRIPFLVSC